MPLGAWLIFIAANLARVAFGVQQFSVGAVGPDLIAALDLSYAALGTLVGIYSLPGTAVTLPGGWLAARFGDRNMLLVGLGLMAAGGALMTIAAGYPLLLTGRIVSGSGTALLSVVLTKLVLDHVPKALMAVLMGAFVSTYPLGCALGQSLLPLLGDWRLAMAASALLCGLCLFVTVATVPGVSTSGSSARAFQLMPGTLVRLLLMAAVWSFGNASYIVLYSFLPPWLVGHGMTLAQAGAISSLGLYTALLVGPFGGWVLSRSIGLESGTILCMAGFGVLAALLPLGVDPIFIAVAAGLLGGLCAGPILAIALGDLDDRERIFAVAIFYSIFYIIMAVCPTIAGWARDLTHRPEMPFHAAAAFAALATASQIAYDRLARKKRAA
jgi:predicted MFS family arabinose efflux permease